MSQVVTNAGEALFAQKAQANKQLDIDTFIFAYVPGQDSQAPVERSEGLPPTAQQVHTQTVQQVGRINNNTVVYSTVLNSVTGPFEFNWVGLYSSVNNTLVAISHVKSVNKTITQLGNAGNTLNRNFAIEYSGISDITGITVAPETWQLDFSARLAGMDELTQNLAMDMNGRDWFIGDGFKVIPTSTNNQFKIVDGIGYVSGLRIKLDSTYTFTLSNYPQYIYVDAWFDGTRISNWKGQFDFTISTSELYDYEDDTGKKHYVFKLATVSGNNVIEDFRNIEGLPQKVEQLEINADRFYEDADKPLPTFNTFAEAKLYKGNYSTLRVMGKNMFGDNGSGIFIIDEQQSYLPESIDRFKNTITQIYWKRILADESDTYTGIDTFSIIKAAEKKALSPWGQKSPFNILGDSITFEYFASYDGTSGDASSYGGGKYYHGWTGILARMLANEFGTNCYKGFSPSIYEYGGDHDVFKKTASVGWSEGIHNSGEFTANLYGGQAIMSNTVGDYIEYTIPATFDEVWLYWCKQPSGGELTIKVNDVVKEVHDTSAESVENGVQRFPMEFNDQGNMVVRFEKTDATSNAVGICGIGVNNDITFTSSSRRGGALNQFAAPGRELKTLSEQVIIDCTEGASAFVLSLGYNDKNLNYSGQEAGRIEFSKRIDWIIQHCNYNKCPLIVTDFTWSFGPDSYTRKELRRAAREARGLYVPLPDLLKKDGLTTDLERIRDLRMWWDGAHPNRNGYQWIAQTVAKYMGLSCTTKKDAIMHHDYWMAMDLKPEYRNIITNQNWTVASYKISGDLLLVKTQIAKSAGGNFADGSHNICKNDILWRDGLEPPAFPTPFTLIKPHEIDNSNDVLSTARVSASPNMGFSLIRTPGVLKTSMNGAATFELRRYDF